MDVVIVITEFKRHMQTRGYAKRTIELYAWALDCFRQYLVDTGIHNIRKVNHQIMIQYQAHVMSQPLAMETKAIKIRGLKRLFDYLTDTHRLLINPTEGIVESNRQKRKIGTVLTIEEMQRLLAQPNLSLRTQLRDRAVMEVLYSTGIRANELLNLSVYDVDLGDKVLYIRKGKGGRQRVVPLNRKAVQYLKEYLEKIRPRYGKKNPKERKLFLTDEGRPLTWNCIRTKINMYRVNAGIKKSIGLHAFRRSVATHMLQQGADIRYIQKLLGHKYLKTTQRYIKVIPVEVKATHNKTHPNARDRHPGS